MGLIAEHNSIVPAWRPVILYSYRVLSIVASIFFICLNCYLLLCLFWSVCGFGLLFFLLFQCSNNNRVHALFFIGNCIQNYCVIYAIPKHKPIYIFLSVSLSRLISGTPDIFFMGLTIKKKTNRIVAQHIGYFIYPNIPVSKFYIYFLVQYCLLW